MRILDLFCKAGGASDGIRRVFPYAEIVGVDIELQPNYPFSFVCSDVFDLSVAFLQGFDFIWASPLCERWCPSLSVFPGRAEMYSDLITPLRPRLIAAGVPYVIENVVRAPLIRSVMLCGTMFDLGTYRHRVFESNVMLLQPVHRLHRSLGLSRVRQGCAARLPGEVMSVTGHFTDRMAGARALGISREMTRDELAHAVPPVYAEYLTRCVFGVWG